MKIIIADDHPLVRDGLRMLVEAVFTGCEMVEAASFGQVISILTGDRQADLIIADFTMSDMAAADGLRAIKRAAPLAPLVVISARSDTEAYETAHASGAAAFVEKTHAHERLTSVINRVMKGERIFPPGIAPAETAATPAPGGIEALTPRQQQVLALLGRGLANKEIAAEIGITVGTVKIYLNAIYRALGVRNRTQAALVARGEVRDQVPSV